MRTGNCSCGADIEEVIDTPPSRGKFWQRAGTTEVCVDNHWHEPAEPVIEVAPGEPTCEYCGPVCYGGAGHNARVEDGARYTDAPAVPAQEAPRETVESCPKCGIGWSKTNSAECPECVPAEPQAGAQPICKRCGFRKGVHHRITGICPGARSTAFEPAQAGAQVPSQVSTGNPTLDELVSMRAALQHIRNYATEAAKTPITREDMHDPLKAQTFFDEAKGFERLVLSEIGGPK